MRATKYLLNLRGTDYIVVLGFTFLRNSYCGRPKNMKTLHNTVALLIRNLQFLIFTDRPSGKVDTNQHYVRCSEKERKIPLESPNNILQSLIIVKHVADCSYDANISPSRSGILPVFEIFDWFKVKKANEEVSVKLFAPID